MSHLKKPFLACFHILGDPKRTPTKQRKQRLHIQRINAGYVHQRTKYLANDLYTERRLHFLVSLLSTYHSLLIGLSPFLPTNNNYSMEHRTEYSRLGMSVPAAFKLALSICGVIADSVNEIVENRDSPAVERMALQAARAVEPSILNDTFQKVHALYLCSEPQSCRMAGYPDSI
jgi:hypothetical protein